MGSGAGRLGPPLAQAGGSYRVGCGPSVSPPGSLHVSLLQATRSAAGTIRRNSPMGCRPRLADPSARLSPRGSPLLRMDPPEVRRAVCAETPENGLCRDKLAPRAYFSFLRTY